MPQRRRTIATSHYSLASLLLAVACGGDRSPIFVKSTEGANASTAKGSSGGAVALGGSGGLGAAAALGSSGGLGGVAALGGSMLGGGGTTEAQAGNSPATAGTASIVAGTATASVTLNLATTYQTLEGFGAAVAWCQDTLISHRKREEVYPILFAELGLDILRFRNTYGRSEFGKAVAEKAILDAATASLGRRPKVLLASWSPPAALKANDAERCSGETACTLKKTNNAYPYAEFANYWADSFTAYRDAGVSADWISIQNEPDFIPNSWEGCKFDPKESASYPGYAEALAAVSAKMATLTAPPALIGPEVLGVHWSKMNNYMPALNKSLLAAAAHHLYEMGNDGVWDWRAPGPDSYLTPLNSAKSVSGSLPIFQTEFATNDDNGTEGGFETAWLMHDSLVDEGVSAWLYWDLIWVGQTGLVALPGSTSYIVRDQYYAMRHYSLYTDPGYVRIGADASKVTLRVSAFRSPGQKRITIVVLNVGTSEERVSFGLGTFAAQRSEVYRTVFVPGSSARWVTQSAVDHGGLLTLPSRSMATVVING